MYLCLFAFIVNTLSNLFENEQCHWEIIALLCHSTRISLVSNRLRRLECVITTDADIIVQFEFQKTACTLPSQKILTFAPLSVGTYNSYQL